MISFSTILLRLGVTLILGALVGLEREVTEHAAGMRTNALVALGAALFTLIGEAGFASVVGHNIQADPTRIASYVVAGIGFLGAGTIFFQRERERVKGLTTAAAIWIVAAIGMACAVGWLLEAVAATALALIVQVALRYVERIVVPHNPANLQLLNVEVATGTGGQLIGQLYDACVRAGISIERVEIRAGEEKRTEKVVIGCYADDIPRLMRAVSEVKAISEVQAVSVEKTP
jgi:putative Mg2+ transporter-C (MgtC) family protein